VHRGPSDVLKVLAACGGQGASGDQFVKDLSEQPEGIRRDVLRPVRPGRRPPAAGAEREPEQAWLPGREPEVGLAEGTELATRGTDIAAKGFLFGDGRLHLRGEQVKRPLLYRLHEFFMAAEVMVGGRGRHPRLAGRRA
jgi:hypothetical protein